MAFRLLEYCGYFYLPVGAHMAAPYDTACRKAWILLQTLGFRLRSGPCVYMSCKFLLRVRPVANDGENLHGLLLVFSTAAFGSMLCYRAAKCTQSSMRLQVPFPILS